jgi:hypothetical protein
METPFGLIPLEAWTLPRLRLRQLASAIPGESFAFGQNIHQIVVKRRSLRFGQNRRLK